MKWFSILVLSVFFTFAAFGLILQTKWGIGLAQARLEKSLKDAGFQIEVQSVEGSFPQLLIVNGLQLKSEDFSLFAQHLEIKLSLLGLFKKQLIITELKGHHISWTNSTSSSESIYTDLPLSLKINHFDLKDVLIPKQFPIHIRGNAVFRKNQKSFHIHSWIGREGFPSSFALMDLDCPETQIVSFKGHFQTNSLDVIGHSVPWDTSCNIHVKLKGPVSAFLNEEGQITGQLKGKIAPRLKDLSLLSSFLETEWRLSSRIQKKGLGNWEFSHSVAQNDTYTLKGAFDYSSKMVFNQGEFVLSHNADSWITTIQLQTTQEERIRIQSLTQIPLFHIDGLDIQNVRLNAEGYWNNSSIEANSSMTLEAFSKIWTGQCELIAFDTGALSLSKLQLISGSVKLEGKVQKNPLGLWSGDLDLQIGNLQDFSIPFYGQLDTKLQWSQPNKLNPPTYTILGKGTNFYWNDLFLSKVSFQSDGTVNINQLQGQFSMEASRGNWRGLEIQDLEFKADHFKPTEWSFESKLNGRWKHLLSIGIKGLIDQTALGWAGKIQELEGSFFNHPLHLGEPVVWEWAPDVIKCNPLYLELDEAKMFFFLNRTLEQTQLELSLQKFPLDMFSLNPLELAIDGMTNLHLVFEEKDQTSSGFFSASLEQLSIDSLGMVKPLNSSGVFQARLKNERLDFKGGLDLDATPLLSTTFSIPIQISSWPFKLNWKEMQPLSGKLNFSGRLEEVLDFFDLGTHRLEGTASCSFVLSGTPTDPHLKGYARLEDGLYENYFTGTSLHQLNAELSAQNKLLTLKSLSGQDSQNKGTFQGSGHLALDPTSLFPFECFIDFQKLNLVQIDLITTEANGNIEINGNLKEATVRGKIDILESDLSIPNRIPKTFPHLEVTYLNPIKPATLPTPPLTSSYPLHLNLEVNAPEGIFISGRGLESEWKGRFQLEGLQTEMMTQGSLELVKGDFSFSGRHFKLRKGELSLKGDHYEIPYIDLSASTTVKNIDILARIQGPLNNPQITLESIPSLPLSTLFSYLLFGQDIAEINSFQALQLANSIASLAGDSPDLMEKTRKALGVDQLNIVSKESGDSDLSETIALQVGKYISEGVLVSYTQSAEENGSSISIEIELNHGFIFQLESDQKQEQGKFTLKWGRSY